MQFYVINPKSQVIQKCGTEGVRPVCHLIVDRRFGKPGAEDRSRVDGRIALMCMRIPSRDMVLFGRVVVTLDIKLIRVELLRLNIERVVSSNVVAGCLRVQGGGKESCRNWINHAYWYLVVYERLWAGRIRTTRRASTSSGRTRVEKLRAQGRKI